MKALDFRQSTPITGPAGLQDRLSWRPLGLRAAESAGSNIAGVISNALHTAARLSSWYTRFNLRARPWLGWLPLSLEYPAETGGFERLADAYPSVTEASSDRHSLLGKLGATPASFPVSAAPTPAEHFDENRLAAPGREFGGQLDSSQKRRDWPVNEDAFDSPSPIGLATLRDVRTVIGAKILERHLLQPPQDPVIQRWSPSPLSELSPSIQEISSYRVVSHPSSNQEIEVAPSALGSSISDFGSSGIQDSLSASRFEATEDFVPEPAQEPGWSGSEEGAGVQGRAGLIERLVDRQTIRLQPVPGLELRWVAPAEENRAVEAPARVAEDVQLVTRPKSQQPPAQPQAPQIDMNQLTDRVYESILRRQALERERKGLS